MDGRRMGGGRGECGEFHYEQTALVDGSWMAGGRGECGACHYKQQSGHRCDTQFGQHCERRRAKAKTFSREGFRRFLELSLVHPAVLCCHVKPPENCKSEKKALCFTWQDLNLRRHCLLQVGDDSHAQQFGDSDVFLIYVYTTAAPTDSDSPRLTAEEPKNRCGRGRSQVVRLGKKGRLDRAENAQNRCAGLPVSKDQVRSALHPSSLEALTRCSNEPIKPTPSTGTGMAL